MNKSSGNFRIQKTYLQKVMKQQANYVVATEDGVSMSKNPIEGIAPSANVCEVKSKTPGFRMRKTFYTMADR